MVDNTFALSRSWARLTVLFCILAALTAPVAAATGNRVASDPTSAEAYVTFDVASGEVVAAQNERTPMLAASTFKVLTALVVRANVDLNSTVPISTRATQVPALKLDLAAGEHWNANALLHAMLIASLNDAAFALAEAAGGGSLEGFEEAVATHARRLGFEDSTVMRDPAGLDDEFANGDGNLISARDLAIATRAFLADPLLVSIGAMRSYEFDGGDGKPHSVISHNNFLASYPGAIGVKTGYTERSGSSLIAAASRHGQTFAVVVLDAPDPGALAAEQLDAAFRRAETSGEQAMEDSVDVLPDSGIAQTALDGRPAPSTRPTLLHAQIPLEGDSNVPVAAGFVVLSITLLLTAGRIGGRGRRDEVG